MPQKRILHVTSVLNHGGIENLLIGILKHIDKENFIFDFLVVREDEGILEEEIKKQGSKIFKIPSMKKSGYFTFRKNLASFFKSHPEYDVIHCHLNTLNGPVLAVAKECGIQKRISHSHTAFPKYSFFESIVKCYFRKMIYKSATDFVACSENAGKWLYGKHSKKCKVILNGIDFERFSFSEEKRSDLRKRLNIEDKFVLLNVGRFSKEKNQIFLLNILSKIRKKRNDAILICVGDGKTKAEFIEKAEKYGHTENVIVLESQSNIEDFYSASDIYLAPSLFEGFGVSVLEAQANGLPCIVSDCFSAEIKSLPCCESLSVNTGAIHWAECVLNLYTQGKRDVIALNKNFDIDNTAKDFCKLYQNFIR